PEYLKEFEYIYFAGFLAFTFTDASLVKKILINLPSELILHSEKEKLQDSSLTNIFYHHWKILNLLQATSENVEILPGLPSEEVSITSIHIQKSRDIIDEVSYILHTLSHTLKRYLPHRTGIVVGDESFYLPLTDALEKFNIGYNLSMGIPFTHTPLYSFLRSAYELIDSDLHATQLFTFLKHPLIKGIESPLYSPERTTACESEGKERVSFRPLIYELDRRMRERNVSYFDENLKDSRNEILVDFILGIVEELNRNDPFPEYVRNVRGMLHKLLNLNEQFFKNNADTAGRLMEELIKVENTLIPEALFSSGKDKLRFLIKVLEGVSFRQFGDFLNGIQVIGVLESRNLDFDCIVIPSCNEGIFPRKSEKDLFLPANLRKEAGLPYYKEREALYSYYFHQLITGKKEVYISYRSEEDGELTLRSRWIEELLYTKKRSFVVREETSKNLTNIFVTGRLRREAILKGTAKEGAVINTLKDMSFSPSSLKTYRECSYKFYLSYILKLKEPVLIQEEFDHALWGAIIHNSLKRLYSDFYPEGYGMEEKTQVMEILFRIGEEEFRNVYPHPKASLYFEWGLYKRRLQGFIEKEISRFREGFKPVKLEEQLNPYILNIGNGLRVKLLGIPDRIDQRGEKFYVLDYKMTTRPQVKGIG
ncbi:MAG TPA: hypothetical protein EYP78_04260, partial [Candidatus Omnitrophica bacterium]|nr:hypothetical protein [Candidatus Omnitrophota bacterium]